MTPALAILSASIRARHRGLSALEQDLLVIRDQAHDPGEAVEMLRAAYAAAFETDRGMNDRGENLGQSMMVLDWLAELLPRGGVRYAVVAAATVAREVGLHALAAEIVRLDTKAQVIALWTKYRAAEGLARVAVTVARVPMERAERILAQLAEALGPAENKDPEPPAPTSPSAPSANAPPANAPPAGPRQVRATERGVGDFAFPHAGEAIHWSAAFEVGTPDRDQLLRFARSPDGRAWVQLREPFGEGGASPSLREVKEVLTGIPGPPLDAVWPLATVVALRGFGFTVDEYTDLVRECWDSLGWGEAPSDADAEEAAP